jgi:hypothetical protein
MRKMKYVGLIALALAASVGLAQAQREVHESRPLSPNGVVEIENIAGTVTVIGWNRDEVEINARLGKGTRGLEVHGDRSHLSIEVELEDYHGRWDEDWDIDWDEDDEEEYDERTYNEDRDRDRDRDRERDRRDRDREEREDHRAERERHRAERERHSAERERHREHRHSGSHSVYVEDSDLEIRVPRGCRVEVDTVSATIEISDHEGEQELDSVSGTIEVRGRPREVELNTVSGTINLVTSGELQNGDFQSISGTIDVEADLSPTGRFDFEVISGSIKLRIPRGTSAEFDVSTFSGRIDNDFGFKPRKTSEWVPGQELRFELGGGGARVTMEALSGTIRILSK